MLKKSFTILATAGILFAQPVAKVTESVYDFGTIQEGDVVTHIFKIENAGTDTLIIGKVRTSCGCTAALVSKDSLLPGETAEIQATFKSKGFTREIEKKVFVETNDLQNPLITFILKGYVEPAPAPEPELSKVVMDVGTLAVGTIETLEVYLRNVGKENLTIEGIEASGLDVLPPFYADAVAPGDSVLLKFELNTKEEGPFTKRVTVITNSPRRSRVFLRINGVAVKK
jgi:hypothetical protein